jgi:F0F1-type ATP synthase epsilon subunit
MKSKIPEVPQLTVIARAPFHLYYDGVAESVSAVNRVGKFDVLPGHADFFSMLDPGEVVIGTATDQVVFTIHNGIISVRDNEVMLFVNM